MLIVSYDFSKDKTRTDFSKFLKKYGFKLQYSVYQIKNSSRVLKNILKEVELNYKKRFNNTDSILIFQVCNGCQSKIIKYGSATHLDEEVIIFQ